MTDHDPYECAPRTTRLSEAGTVAVACSILGGIVAAAMSSPWRYAIIALTVVIVAAAVARAWRLGFTATSRGLEIQNYWRHRTIDWSEVSKVTIGKRSIALVSVPALVLYLKNGMFARAHGTPFDPGEQDHLLRRLQELAPPSVVFEMPNAGA